MLHTDRRSSYEQQTGYEAGWATVLHLHPQGILIAQIFMGYDGQYAKDVQCLGTIGRALAKRWGFSAGKD